MFQPKPIPSGWSKLRGLTPRTVDLSVLSEYERYSLSQLRDPSVVEAVLLTLGLNDEGTEEFPTHLHPYCGSGLLIWQYPIQFAPYLVSLSRMKVRSYLEIGVRHGGSFIATVEHLSRFNELQKAVGIDILPCPSLENYSREVRAQARFLRINSQSSQFERFIAHEGPFDLVFIDGFHKADHIKRELSCLRKNARMIALHDISNTRYPEVQAVWAELKNTRPLKTLEFTEQYDDAPGASSYMGIGLAIIADTEEI